MRRAAQRPWGEGEASVLRRAIVRFVLALFVVAGCSSAKAPIRGGDDGDLVPSTGGRGFGEGDGDDLLSSDGQGGAAPLPEEVEDETSFRAPVVTGAFLWSSNPESGRVALIDARDSSVRLLSAGLRPTEIFPLPGEPEQPRALVQNQGSADASLLELTEGVFRERRIATPHSVNQWAISADGVWAVAFAVSASGVVLDPTEGLQEISVVNLDHLDERPVRLTVGYRPRSIVLSADRAVVVCEDGLAVVRLGAEVFAESWIELGPGGGLDASVTTDARRALVRRSGSEELEIVDLDDPDRAIVITMASPVTDLDLLPSGRVFAVAREAGEILTFLMDEFDEDSNEVHRMRVDGGTIGSAVLAETGERALLYTTAVAERKLAIVELGTENFLSYRWVDLQHGIAGVAASPDGRHGVAFGPGSQTGQGAFSIMRLDEERFPRVVGTRAPVAAIALSNAALLLTAASETVFEAYAGRLPELSVERLTLASRPLSAGILDAEALGYVAQYHPEGRVTFLGIRSGEVRSVSGYELSAEVIEE